MFESVPDCYKGQQKSDKAVDNCRPALKSVPDCYVTQKICDKAVNTDASTMQFVPDCLRIKKCVIKLLIDVFLHLFMLLIDIKLIKCVTELFPKILLC